MTTAESVVDVLHGELNFLYFAGRERLRLFKTMAEFSAKGFAAHQLLVSRHGKRGWRNIAAGLTFVLWPTLVELAVGVVGRIHVNEFHVPIGVCSCRRNEEA